MSVPPVHSLTALALDAKFANKQRRYESKYSASYRYQPSPPPRLAAPPRLSNPMFEALRAAAAELNLPEDLQHGPPAAASAVPTRRHPVRKALLGTVATLALGGLAAGSYYAWAAQGPNGGQAAINATLVSLAQRFHDIGANQPLFRALGEKVALLRPAFTPAPEAGAATSPARNDMAGGVAPPPQPAALAAAMPGQPMPGALMPAPSASPPSPPTPSDVLSPTGAGSPKPSETAASKPEMAELAKPAPAQAEPPTATVAAPDVTDAASVTSAVLSQHSASLLALVSQVSLLMRDTQSENEKLRAEVGSLIGSLQAKMTDLEQRLVATNHDVRDARDEGAQLRTEMAGLADTLQASSKALEQRLLALARDPAAATPEPGKQQAGAASPVSTPADDGKAAAEATTTDSTRTVPGYHVQAASFGVAVLRDASAAPGQAGGRLVTVGDQVPGVGRVTSITPHGTSWVVQTDHGVIQ